MTAHSRLAKMARTILAVLMVRRSVPAAGASADARLPARVDGYISAVAGRKCLRRRVWRPMAIPQLDRPGRRLELGQPGRARAGRSVARYSARLRGQPPVARPLLAHARVQHLGRDRGSRPSGAPAQRGRDRGLTAPTSPGNMHTIMKRHLTPAFSIELALAAVSVFLAIITVLWPDWIELVFNVDPDLGNGSLERAIVGLAFVLTIVFVALARREWRRAAASSG